MKVIIPVLLKKEVTQLRRNSFLPRLLVMLPIMLMLVMPWVTTMDVRNIGIAIIDADQSSLSRRMVSHLASSDYFRYSPDYLRYEDAIEALDRGDIDVVVSIPAHFEYNLQIGCPEPIAIVANGVNATKGSQGMQYSLQTIQTAIQEVQAEKGVTASVADRLHGGTEGGLIVIENRYNPTGDYRYFMIPALMIMLLLLVCCFLPAFNIVGEKEKGTMEQLNVTPITPVQFTLAKLVPYWVIGLVELSLAMLLAWLVYDLAPVGNIGIIYLAAVLFIGTMSAFGVIMANVSNTLQQTIFLMFFFVMLFMLMSGLMTPIASMPQWAQYITLAFPTRYFIAIMRAVYLKGTTLVELLPHILALLGFMIGFFAIAMKTYKKQS